MLSSTIYLEMTSVQAPCITDTLSERFSNDATLNRKLVRPLLLNDPEKYQAGARDGKIGRR